MVGALKKESEGGEGVFLVCSCFVCCVFLCFVLCEKKGSAWEWGVRCVFLYTYFVFCELRGQGNGCRVWNMCGETRSHPHPYTHEVDRQQVWWWVVGWVLLGLWLRWWYDKTDFATTRHLMTTRQYRKNCC